MTLQNTTPSLTPSFVAEALDQKLLSQTGADIPFSHVTTDSRALAPGGLFVAIEGEKFDGHAYITEVLEKGAKGILCRKGTQIDLSDRLSEKGSTVFVFYASQNTLDSYRKIAQKWRKEFSIPTVCVAGSVGKTSTKEMLAAILSGKWSNVLKTSGSQNGYLGIPMTLLQLNGSHGAAVIEVGIDEIGAMQKHIDLIHPSCSVLTAIGPEHLLYLKDVPTVAHEEGLALTLVAQYGGTVAINLNDDWIRPHFKTIKDGRKIAFKLLGPPDDSPSKSEDQLESKTESDAQSTLTGRLTEDFTELEVQGLGWPSTRFLLPLPGRHNASNLLAALAAAAGLGLTPEEARAGLLKFSGASGRSEVRTLGEITVLCDYYNASPPSVAAGIELCAQIHSQNQSQNQVKSSAPGRKRIACLGDMLELGTEEVRFHQDLAAPLIANGFERILLFGPLMAHLAKELHQKGAPCQHFSTREELVKVLINEARSGDTVLIKGSKSTRMDLVWSALEAHWSRA